MSFMTGNCLRGRLCLRADAEEHFFIFWVLRDGLLGSSGQSENAKNMDGRPGLMTIELFPEKPALYGKWVLDERLELIRRCRLARLPEKTFWVA